MKRILLSVLALFVAGCATTKQPEPFVPRVSILDSIDSRLLVKCEERGLVTFDKIEDIIVVKGKEETEASNCRRQLNALIDELNKAKTKEVSK